MTTTPNTCSCGRPATYNGQCNTCRGTERWADVRGACPATGRSASVCADQSHLACWAGRRSSIELDLKVEAELAELESPTRQQRELGRAPFTMTTKGGRVLNLTSEHQLRDAMERNGLRHGELTAHVADVRAGHTVWADNGTHWAKS